MRRRLGLFLIIGAAVSLIAVSTAWACGVLATLTAPSTAAPGSTVNVTGRNYSSSASFGAVQIRLNSRTATPIGSATVGADTKINTNVTLPAGLSPGWYVVLGTQTNTTTGVPKSGTPGRTSIRVQGAAAASRRHGGAAVTPWSSTTPPGGSGGLAVKAVGGSGGSAFVPTLLGIFLSLGLLGGGVTLVARSRTANRPGLGA